MKKGVMSDQKVPGGALHQAYNIDKLALVRKQQEATLERNRQDGKRWCQLKEDYVKLRGTLEELPKEVSREAVVPLGKKAFMLGRLVHTNEVLVLLGDNWFVERSAAQAVDIVDRRLAR